MAICIGAAGSAIAADDLSRGQYLVEALAACDNCHTPRGPGGYDFSVRFSGGSQTFSGADYVARGSNISSDNETGVGGWGDDALRAAIIAGKGRDGTLAPAMPSDSYRVLTKDDLDGVIAFLRAAAPVRAPSAAPSQRHGAWAPHPLPGAEAPFDESARAVKIKRGLYIASVARCMACHSGEVEDAPDHVKKLGAGGKIFRTPAGVAVASNISAHREKGVGAWSDEDIKRAITQGVSRNGDPLKPPMSTLAKAHFAKMSPDDLDALIAYLRSIPAKE
ncbi:cytochrome c [Methylocystis sp. MJC1]|uniref:c-type cytochrome n=1 Tax=Methylocystis sp. MJC1 TaxID=2654282 RepID=UPI001FEE51F6|nr:c-type cytochrome [Methylocystis sp. MJC1]UZX11736.1 cytochrome c [Methylocystis sp. MJC1]